MHDNRVTRLVQLPMDEYKSQMRKLDTKAHKALQAKRKRQRQARKASRNG